MWIQSSATLCPQSALWFVGGLLQRSEVISHLCASGIGTKTRGRRPASCPLQKLNVCACVRSFRVAIPVTVNVYHDAADDDSKMLFVYLYCWCDVGCGEAVCRTPARRWRGAGRFTSDRGTNRSGQKWPAHEPQTTSAHRRYLRRLFYVLSFILRYFDLWLWIFIFS